MSTEAMISIVDDDAFVRHATENLLLSLGFGVITFASAEEFLESGRADDTSCLITDMRMPGLTGLELQQRLIEEGKRLPVIFITAFFTESLRAQALAAGAVGFLSKPYGEASLIECLDRALAGRSASIGFGH
jgi:FixJ family two-component response regulator